jgi:hypothetical protein
MEVLDSIPVSLDVERQVKRFHVSEKSERLGRRVDEILEGFRPIAKPKVIYEVCYVDNKNRDSVEIGGVSFTSRVLRINLDKVERVFPYVATCGRELEEMAVPPDDRVKYFCLDIMKMAAVASAHTYLQDYLAREYALGQMSRMNPGSLEDWPVTQQIELFSLFGNVEDLIGVTLTENFLMVPLKSVSGIYFPTEIKFESCQLCPRERCVGRMAPYRPDLVEHYA